MPNISIMHRAVKIMRSAEHRRRTEAGASLSGPPDANQIKAATAKTRKDVDLRGPARNKVISRRAENPLMKGL